MESIKKKSVRLTVSLQGYERKEIFAAGLSVLREGAGLSLRSAIMRLFSHSRQIDLSLLLIMYL